MTPKTLITIISITIVAIITTNCQKEISGEQTPVLNTVPKAIAGPDQVITLPVDSILLEGNGSIDNENNITSYEWIQVSGPPSITITTFSPGFVKVKNFIEGIYQFELKVTDAFGLYSKDTIQVTVNLSNQADPCIENRPLVPAQLIALGTLSNDRWLNISASTGYKLLIAGGKDFQWPDIYNTVDIYDPNTQNMSTADLSETRQNMGVATAGDKIFFAGGNKYYGVLSNRIDIYDAATNSWSIDSLGAPRSGMTGVTADNKIFFAGGGYTDIYVKDLLTNTWSTKNLSEPKAGISALTIGTKIYFAGGGNNIDISNKIDVYDYSSSTWSVETMLEPKTGFASIATAGKIYYAGGYTTGGKKSNLVEIKDIATNTSTQSCLFQPRANFSAVLKDNKIIFFTSNDYFSIFNGSTEVFNKFDIYDISTGKWSIGVLPVSISGASIISVNNTIYVAGGIGDLTPNKLWKLEF